MPSNRSGATTNPMSPARTRMVVDLFCPISGLPVATVDDAGAPLNVMGGASGLAGFGELLDVTAVHTLIEVLYSDTVEASVLDDRVFLNEYCQVYDLAPDTL